MGIEESCSPKLDKLERKERKKKKSDQKLFSVADLETTDLEILRTFQLESQVPLGLKETELKPQKGRKI